MSDKISTLSLSSLKCYSIKFNDGTVLSVPIFLVSAFKLIKSRIRTIGIFQNSGSRQLVMLYPFFGEFSLPTGANIYDVCNLVKRFFRDLEIPLLFTNDLEREFLNFRNVSEDRAKIRYVLDACQQLPTAHRDTLAFLMRQLKRVASFSEFNNMTERNLASVFAPFLFRQSQPPESGTEEDCETLEALKLETETKINLLEILIENAEEIRGISDDGTVLSCDFIDDDVPPEHPAIDASSNLETSTCSNEANPAELPKAPISNLHETRSKVEKRRATTVDSICEKLKERFQAESSSRLRPPKYAVTKRPVSSRHLATRKKISSVSGRRQILKRIKDSQDNKGRVVKKEYKDESDSSEDQSVDETIRRVISKSSNQVDNTVANSEDVSCSRIINEKLFSCRICTASFRHVAELKNHFAANHIGEKPYACEVCSTTFSRKDKLNHHMLRHKVQKPFLCKICGKWFRFKSTLSEHKSIHFDDRPFGCRFCGKSFRLKRMLKSHLERLHVKDAPEELRRLSKKGAVM